MIVTKIEYIDKKRAKIYIDEEYGFLLYCTDIRKNKLVEDEIITDQLYEEILEETVFRRAKQKAMAILKYMDRTEAEIRKKLQQAYYTTEIIDRTIAYIKSYNYIDDRRLALSYVSYKKDIKSKRQLSMDLYKKGLDKELIAQVLEEEFIAEDAAVIKAIKKKTNDVTLLTFEEKQKIAASLYRKGFQRDIIQKYCFKSSSDFDEEY